MLFGYIGKGIQSKRFHHLWICPLLPKWDGIEINSFGIYHKDKKAPNPFLHRFIKHSPSPSSSSTLSFFFFFLHRFSVSSTILFRFSSFLFIDFLFLLLFFYICFFDFLLLLLLLWFCCCSSSSLIFCCFFFCSSLICYCSSTIFFFFFIDFLLVLLRLLLFFIDLLLFVLPLLFFFDFLLSSSFIFCFFCSSPRAWNLGILNQIQEIPNWKTRVNMEPIEMGSWCSV